MASFAEFHENNQFILRIWSRPCDSINHYVGWSVGQSVGPSVCWSVGLTVRQSITKCELTPISDLTCINALAHPYATDVVVYTAMFICRIRFIVKQCRCPVQNLNYQVWTVRQTDGQSAIAKDRQKDVLEYVLVAEGWTNIPEGFVETFLDFR